MYITQISFTFVSTYDIIAHNWARWLVHTCSVYWHSKSHVIETWILLTAFVLNV